MGNKFPSYLLHTEQFPFATPKVRMAKFSFLDKTILNSARAVKSIYLQAEDSTKENYIRNIHPRIKIIALIYFAVVISIVSNPFRQIFITAFIFLLYILVRIKIFAVYRKIFIIAFLFGFLVVLPASLNIITRGKIILNIITFNAPSHFWIYDIPKNIGFTENGFQVVLLVFLRVLNSVSFALLIVYTTPFPSFIKSFKVLGVPDTFLMIITLAYKYIFILSRTIEETYFALKSRISGNIKSSIIRKLISGRVFFIFRRSVIIYESTYFAMVSRGYHGKIKLSSQQHLTIMDIVALIFIVVSGIVVILF